MGLEEDFGLALADIKNVLSSRSFSYLTSVLKRDEDNSQRTIGERSSTNWTESSGKISTISSEESQEISCSSNRDSKETTTSGSISSSVSVGDSEDCETNSSATIINSQDQREEATTRRKNVLTVTVPFVDENEGKRRHQRTTKAEIEETQVPEQARHLNLSSLQKAVGITLATKDDALSSHLFPVCPKILRKATTAKSTTIGSKNGGGGREYQKSVSVIAEKRSTYIPIKDCPYEAIIGKIAETEVQRDFARGIEVSAVKAKPLPKISTELLKEKSITTTKGKVRRTAGVCDLSHPISNPLYKVYDPKGYVKSEDELAREYIDQIGEEFNGWLASLEGEPVQLDTQDLTKILRDELELPGPPPVTVGPADFTDKTTNLQSSNSVAASSPRNQIPTTNN